MSNSTETSITNMNSTNFDPDMKINMSLDDIIRLTNPQPLCQKIRKTQHKKRRHGKKFKSDDHSVPLPLGGGVIYVTKNSPLLRVRRQREIQSAALNRILNLKLLNKTKKIIPANYKLVKTSQGLERVLVPAEDVITKFQANDTPVWISLQSLCNASQDQGTQTSPPVELSTSLPVSSICNTLKMEVDDPDDDIVVLNTKSRTSQTSYVIDVENDSFTRNSGIVNQNSFASSLPDVPRTLNDRFTMLCSSSQV